MDFNEENVERPRGAKESQKEDSATESFMLMRSYLEQQFSSFKKDIREEIQTSSASSYKRFKQSSQPYSFKWEGNRKQFYFNSDILEELESATNLVKRGEQYKSLGTLEGIQKKVNRRNQLIKLADKSDGGWDTVREYESDDLASDSEDDKRIRKAESRALSKKKNRSAKRTSAPQLRQPGESTAINSSDGLSAPRAVSSTFRSFRRGNQPFQCFACGGWGHFRGECPRLLQGPGTHDYSVPRRPTTSWQPNRDQQQFATTSRQQSSGDNK